MISLEGLRKSYPEFTMDLSLEVGRGELVSILGPSGSGKTTTLRLLGGFERPDAGVVRVGGVDVTDLSPSRRNLGFVFQDYTLFPHMNVYENVAYGLRARRRGSEEIRRTVTELLGRMGLSGYEKRNVQTLSGGEKQRIAIARALAIDPAVLILDEPFSSIDAPMRKGLREEIVRLQRELGITTIFVTHSQEEALSVSDRVVVMQEGRIVQIDAPDVLYRAPRTRFVASFVGVANFLEGRIRELDGSAVIQGRDGGQLRVELDPARAADSGAEVTVMVRPEKLRFVADDGEPAVNRIPVRIRSRQYFAHYFEYLCAAADTTLSVYDTERRTVDSDTVVSFDPADAIVLPD
jgi:ABC-type Fe3+/spermidine/putrescine transport system ATPase subunit